MSLVAANAFVHVNTLAMAPKTQMLSEPKSIAPTGINAKEMLSTQQERNSATGPSASGVPPSEGYSRACGGDGG